MSKELTPLEALKIVKKHLPTLYPEECGFDNIDGCFGPLKECQYELDIIETALKDYERRLKLAKEYEDVNNVAKRLKALEIISELPTEIKQELLNASYTHFKNDEYYDLLKEVLL